MRKIAWTYFDVEQDSEDNGYLKENQESIIGALWEKFGFGNKIKNMKK